MKWLLEHRFSYLDLMGIFVLISLFSAGLWVFALIWLIIGTTLVTELEDRFGGDDE